MAGQFSSSFVYADLPNAGLGNMMTVWARALVFAELNDLNRYTTKWWRFHAGPWLRGEQNKRWYFSYFRHDYLSGWIESNWKKKRWNLIPEPTLDKVEIAPKSIYLFQSHLYPGFDNTDSFKGLKAHRTLIQQELQALLSEEVRTEVAALTPPCIGLHIRRGDFKSVSWGITPNQFFIDVVQNIRKLNGKELPVTIFTDGHPEEMADLLALPEVRLSEPKSDIADLIQLSQSRVIVYSMGSSFSYWAGFLSNAALIMPSEKKVYQPSRLFTNPETYRFQGYVGEDLNDWDARLVTYLKDLDC